MNTKNRKVSLLNKEILWPAIKASFFKLNPLHQFKNPVMFVAFVGASLSLAVNIGRGEETRLFDIQITLWLWFTVLFANFAEGIAEGRGKAQAESLKKSRTSTVARVLTHEGEIRKSAAELVKNDLVVCEAGDVIPGDGEVVEGIASVDESAITGESAPVVRESGGDRSAVTGGTRVLSDRIVVKITAEVGSSFLDRMISLVEGAKRQKTPNEIALSIVLSGLTIVMILAVMTIKPFADFAAKASEQNLNDLISVPVLIALLVCLIPTTISGLLSAIGISGMDRLIQKNVIATSGRAVEAAGDIDVLLLDKTGTITLGNRMASHFLPVQGISEERLARASYFSSLSDETAEGRSIVTLAEERFGLQKEEILIGSVRYIPFTAQTRMSGIDIYRDDAIVSSVRKGAADSIKQYVFNKIKAMPVDLDTIVESISQSGGTPLVVVDSFEILGVIHLKDVVKPGIKERFSELRNMGIRTVMITGDNPLTAAAIAAEAGVDDFMAQATPESKLKRIREEQEKGHLVAMTGDGTNDAPALAQSDVGVAMNSGTQAAREAGNMVDLDSNPTKLIEIVEVGKQLLMTRGSLTTFSITNDVAKYFAILPALFGTLYKHPQSTSGPLGALNLMALHSPQSAILSAVIFNALIIVILIPLALKGVKYKAMSASAILKRNLLIYGVGGLIVPFVGIKIIDVVVQAFNLV